MTHNNEAIFLSEELFVTGLQFDTKEDVLRHLSQMLHSRDLVKESFFQGIIDRENEYPTGIRTKTVQVAIPHTHPDHVLRSSLAVAVLPSPVSFRDMIDGESEVQAQLVFMFAMSEASKHVKLMQQIMSLFQNDSQMEAFLNYTSSDLYRYFSDLLFSAPAST